VEVGAGILLQGAGPGNPTGAAQTPGFGARPSEAVLRGRGERSLVVVRTSWLAR